MNDITHAVAQAGLRRLKILTLKRVFGVPISESTYVATAAEAIRCGVGGPTLHRLAVLSDVEQHAAPTMFRQVVTELQLFTGECTEVELRWEIVALCCGEFAESGPTADLVGFMWIEGWGELGFPAALTPLTDAIAQWENAAAESRGSLAHVVAAEARSLLRMPWPPPLTPSARADATSLHHHPEPQRDTAILSADPNSVFHGPYAHALACGAHLAIANEDPWNTPLGSYSGPQELRDYWGVTDPASWREAVEGRLGGAIGGSAGEHALRVRRDLQEAWPGAEIALPDWMAAIAAYAQAQNISGQGTEAMVEACEAIVRWERWFLRDGVLQPGQHARSVLAYDYGRAVNLIRWGYQSGYCTAETAWASLLPAGANARRVYQSWPDFAVGYFLGRMLLFGDEGANWYLTTLDIHRVLTTSADSPWLNIPFR